MVATSTVCAAAALFTGALAAPPLFPSENTQLTDSIIGKVASSQSDLFGFQQSLPPKRQCKVYPGDRDWPADWAWGLLNKVVDNRLLKPHPHAAVCYQGEYHDATACATLTANWQNNSYIHMEDPIEMLSPVFQGRTCMPPGVFDSGNCTMGGFPMYVINATTPKHVQAGINFARNTGVRLVVKNTGHDFAGKSGGRNALSIWTRHFKDIKYIENYRDKKSGYKGAAFKCGTGVQAFEIYKAAAEKGKVVVGGEGQTVGVMGGYIQGGGHSPLSSVYGTGADQVLAFEVVTADGRFVTADSTQNTDLFWAMRGGGGSTYGVATSVTVKAHPDTKTTISQFSFDTSNITTETFWKGVRAYWDYMEGNVDAGTYAYSLIVPNPPPVGGFSFIMWNFFAPNYTKPETEALLAPWLTQLSSFGINVAPLTRQYDSYYPAWVDGFPLETVGKPSSIYGNRLWPRSNFQDPTKLQNMFDVIKGRTEKGYVQVLFNMKATDPTGWDNAVNPAWRENVLMNILAIDWPQNATSQQMIDAWHNLTHVDMELYRQASPGAGAYLAESDRLEPNWQQAFFGTNYPRLLAIKKKRDPSDLFWAVTAVGSEGWKVQSTDFEWTENGRLCRV